jgi:hypothetical protein
MLQEQGYKRTLHITEHKQTHLCATNQAVIVYMLGACVVSNDWYDYDYASCLVPSTGYTQHHYYHTGSILLVIYLSRATLYRPAKHQQQEHTCVKSVLSILLRTLRDAQELLHSI